MLANSVTSLRAPFCQDCGVQLEGLVGRYPANFLFTETKQTKGFDSRVVCLVGHVGDAQVLLSLWKIMPNRLAIDPPDTDARPRPQWLSTRRQAHSACLRDS